MRARGRTPCRFENHATATRLDDGGAARSVRRVRQRRRVLSQEGCRTAAYGTYLHGPLLPATRGSQITCSPRLRSRTAPATNRLVLEALNDELRNYGTCRLSSACEVKGRTRLGTPLQDVA
jgi:CobQ-like glutamine amidotransferase family enzyme